MDAYPDQDFPVTDEGSRCVFCQQELAEKGAQRLIQFKKFLDSTAQSEHDAAAQWYREKQSAVTDMVVRDGGIDEAVDELQIEDVELADSVRAFLEKAEARREKVVAALSDSEVGPRDVPVASVDFQALSGHVDDLQERAKELRQPNQAEASRKLRKELSELDARQVLADNIEHVLQAIERKKRIAAYQLCIEDTRTNAITRKSSEVTRRA